jgi:hypothetical protein
MKKLVPLAGLLVQAALRQRALQEAQRAQQAGRWIWAGRSFLVLTFARGFWVGFTPVRIRRR